MFNPACAPAHAPFLPNANIIAPNFNQNVGLPSTVNMSQNNPLHFLTMPPPNLIASQHAFPSAINTNTSPAFFAPNMAVRPPQPFVSSIGTNVPDMKIFQNIPSNHVQSVNMYSNNAQHFGNPGFAGSNGNAMHPVQFSQTGNSFNHIHNPNGDKRSSTPNFNPWSPPPSAMNNFSNVSGTSLQNSTFQSSNRNNMWSDSSRNSSTAETSRSRNFPLKFNGAKSKVSDINPWMNPPISFPDISSNNCGNGTKLMQSPSNVNEYNFNENSAWKTNSNNTFSNHHGKQPQSNWKSGNYSSMKNNQKNSCFESSGNSFKNYHNKKFQGRKNNNSKDKEDREGNKPYACDTCDRAFAVEQELKFHLSEHIKCSAENCDFEAHPKIVFLHKKMQHETGYAEAINKLKDAEEIAKWRAERKRRFPTAENIRKRKAEQAEKEARGEVIETKDFGKMKKPRLENRFNKRHNNRADRRNKHFNSNNLHFRNERLLSTPKVTSDVTLDSDTGSDDDSHIKLQQFPGITYLKENPVVQKPEVVISSVYIDSDKISQHELNSPKIVVSDKNEEEKDVDSDDEAPVEIPVNKTSSLLDVFSAKEDVDSDDEAPVEIPINKTSPVLNAISIKEVSDDDSPAEIPSEICIETELLENKESDIHEINDDSEVVSPTKMPDAKVPLNEISNSGELISRDKSSDKHSTDNGVKSNKKSFDRNRNKFSSRHNEMEQNTVRKSTLLEKLLADDIRHERNVIMQCIRYIVTNNFFDVNE
ncbi:unnamed protein product [Larinioides sclopetarius]|uniref:C2H2-type domain-containing protein n=1 Tax=Larinioides sclopetarius TaxID=280406 RepID=A0AAV2BBG1_9ARAC